jgi:hypothetical protein
MPVSVLIQKISVDILTHYFFKIVFKIALLFVLMLPDFDPNFYISVCDRAWKLHMFSAEASTRCEYLADYENQVKPF